MKKNTVIKNKLNYLLFTVAILICNFNLELQGATPSGAKMVDLGLPSGTLWANMNVGASKSEQYGSFYAWGEVLPKANSDYSIDKYKFYDSGSKVNKYCTDATQGTVDNRKTLLVGDDAACQNWDNNWRMPTTTQYKELKDNCTITWTTLNGVNGVKVTGPNGQYIFLPAGGYVKNGSQINKTERYIGWTLNLNTEENHRAYQVLINESSFAIGDYGGRPYGCSIRPVSVHKGLRLDVSKITLRPYQTRLLILSTKDKDTNAMSTAKWTSSNTSVATVSQSGWVEAKANGTATITVTNTFGLSITCKVTVSDPAEPSGVELVDLGLPSGTLWANMNVGSSKPEEKGSYFSWGETSVKTDHHWTNYRFGDLYTLTRYNVNNSTGNVDNRTVLLGKDDAAYVLWGSDWCMPTKEQFQEMIDNCTVEKTTLNGISGYKIEGPSGNHVFFPVTGYYTEEGLELEDQFICWTKSLNTNNCHTAYQAIAANGSLYLGELGSRTKARVIRPVSSTNKAVRIKTLSFAEGEIALVVGRTKVIKPIVSPSNATAQNFDWSSSNTEIVEVDSEGNIIGINTGHATITIKAKENPQITASFEVDVVLLGDANNDGEVDIVDVVIVYNYLNNEDAGNIVLEACDMNNDNSVSSNDVSLLIDKILDKEIDNNLPNDIEDEAH